MPDEWGRSGQRLRLSFRAAFTASQLFDRDPFLGGGESPAKVCQGMDGFTHGLWTMLVTL